MTPSTIHKPVGYSYVSAVADGTLIYIAGQVALDPEGVLVIEWDPQSAPPRTAATPATTAVPVRLE